MPNINNNWNNAVAGGLQGIGTYINRVIQKGQQDSAREGYDAIIDLYDKYKTTLQNNQKVLIDNSTTETKPVETVKSPYTRSQDNLTKVISEPIGLNDPNQYAKPVEQTAPVDSKALLKQLYSKRMDLMENPYAKPYIDQLALYMKKPEYKYFQMDDRLVALDDTSPLDAKTILEKKPVPVYDDDLQTIVTDNKDGTYSKVVYYKDKNSGTIQPYVTPSTEQEYTMYIGNLLPKTAYMEKEFEYDKILAGIRASRGGGYGFGRFNSSRYGGDESDLYTMANQLYKLEQKRVALGGKFNDAKDMFDYENLIKQVSYQFNVPQGDSQQLADKVQQIIQVYDAKTAKQNMTKENIPRVTFEPYDPNWKTKSIDKNFQNKSEIDLMKQYAPESYKTYESLPPDVQKRVMDEFLNQLQQMYKP